VIAGGGTQAVLLSAGFAAAITESISMGAVGWTSALSERDYYAAEQGRESAGIDATPQAERAEIRDIYAAKGFSRDLLDRAGSASSSAACSTPPAREAGPPCGGPPPGVGYREFAGRGSSRWSHRCRTVSRGGLRRGLVGSLAEPQQVADAESCLPASWVGQGLARWPRLRFQSLPWHHLRSFGSSDQGPSPSGAGVAARHSNKRPHGRWPTIPAPSSKPPTAQAEARVWRQRMRGSGSYMYSRQYVADRLRRRGSRSWLKWRCGELPDLVDADQLENWGMRHGVSKDDLISRMGGSP